MPMDANKQKTNVIIMLGKVHYADQNTNTRLLLEK